jgi:hypothetical protein
MNPRSTVGIPEWDRVKPDHNSVHEDVSVSGVPAMRDPYVELGRLQSP